MKTFIALVLAVVLCGPALSEETPLTPGEFRDYAEGWTLYFELDEEQFGSESFEPGGAVRWRYRDGSCVDGVWRAHGAQICFKYDAEAEAEILCWRMLRDEGGLFARLLNGSNSGLELRITRRDKEPLLCGDPGLPT